METSLRRALDAGDASDPAFRETIYAASERALEHMIASRSMDDASAQAQRIRLAETINRVEQDYFVPEDLAEGAAPLSDEAPLAEGGEEDLPLPNALRAAEPGERGLRPADGETSAFEASALGLPPASASPKTLAGPVRSEDDPEAPSFLRRSPGPASERPKSGVAARPAMSASASPGFGGGGKAAAGSFRKIFVIVVLLAFAILAYLLYGMIYGSSPAPSTGAETSDASGAGEGERWIALFDGTQLASIATPSGGRVEAVTGTDERPAVRMTSAGAEGEIEVAVGPGVVGEIAGETVRVEVTVGSPDGAPREFGIRCLFAGETVCGRLRFTTDQFAQAFVFDMAVPADARRAGSIAFEPGLGSGGPLDLYGVRARVVDAA